MCHLLCCRLLCSLTEKSCSTLFIFIGNCPYFICNMIVNYLNTVYKINRRFSGSHCSSISVVWWFEEVAGEWYYNLLRTMVVITFFSMPSLQRSLFQIFVILQRNACIRERLNCIKWRWNYVLNSNIIISIIGGGAEYYWLVPLTLDQRVNARHHFCPSARHFIHIAALHPGI